MGNLLENIKKYRGIVSEDDPQLPAPKVNSRLIIKQCAALAAIYWNDAGLQNSGDIDDFIIQEMAKPDVANFIRREIRHQTIKR